MRLVLFAAVLALGAMIGVIAAAGDDTSYEGHDGVRGSSLRAAGGGLAGVRRKGSESGQLSDELLGPVSINFPTIVVGQLLA
ncbi:MAG: hypothetical protein IPK42_23715 [Betaproteobacteria bacterium]|nr:hypothetical protein [Betaproteobacteria bacterium]